MKMPLGLKGMFQVVSPSELVHQGSVTGFIDLLLARHTQLSCPVSPADKLPV